MSVPMSTGSLGKALAPGLRAIFGLAYKEHPEYFRDIFDVVKSDRAFEEDLNFSSLGLAPIRPEGENTKYDSMHAAFLKRYVHDCYSLGFAITKNAMDDNMHNEIAVARSKSLARAMRLTKETVCANVLNRAFNSSYTGADGLELCSAAHVRSAGGTYANELAVAANLSEASLEQALIDLSKMKDDRGLNIVIEASSLIIPSDLVFEAQRIVKSPLRSGVADNDINASRDMGMVPNGIKKNPFLTSTTAWFLKTDCPNGMVLFDRLSPEMSDEVDFDSDNVRFKAVMRFAAGWSDPRGIFGSPGV